MFEGWLISPGEYYYPFHFALDVLQAFLMPILFILAGMAACFALQFRSPGTFIKERFTRLFIPCLFGTFVIVPPQSYYQRLSEGAFEGSYLAFYPHFFNGVWPQGNLTWAHLWFIFYLFVYSLVALPLFLYLGRPAGRRIISRVAVFCERPGAIFLFAVPFAVTESLLHGEFPWTWALINDWSMLTWYLWMFIIGYVLCSDDRFRPIIYRHGPVALFGALMLTAVHTALSNMDIWIEPEQTLAWTLFMVSRSFHTWFWIVALLSFGDRFLRADDRLLSYLRECSYPFYILHETILVFIIFHIRFWKCHILLRFTFAMLFTIAATLTVYEIGIRRWRVTRFLLGMRPWKNPL